jgi:hypothetical protein
MGNCCSRVFDPLVDRRGHKVLEGLVQGTSGLGELIMGTVLEGVNHA